MCYEDIYLIIQPGDHRKTGICTNGQLFCMNGHFEIGAVTPRRYFFSIAIVLGLLFALTSGDQDRPQIVILVQWQLQTLLPISLLIGTHMVLLKNAGFAGLNSWLALTISGAVGASIFAPLALMIDFWLEPATEAPFIEELLDEWVSVTPPVVICWLALNTPWLLGYRIEKSADTENQAGITGHNTDNSAEFMTLLPPEQQGRLLLLKSELHYLQVVTDQGSTLILYNLGDAIAQLPETEGLMVHRSYWVAYDAIDELVRRGRQGELKLRDGQTVPVSRNRMQAVRNSLANR